jgi:predicted GH43/DUF377 family glycosyl hydrolase
MMKQNAFKLKNDRWLLYTLFLIICLGLSSCLSKTKDKVKSKEKLVNWNTPLPSDVVPENSDTIQLRFGDVSLSTTDISRRDPSDIIRVGGIYYLWYTKIPKGKPGYPQGWCGTVWYATSLDGHNWTEKGEVISSGSVGDWDGTGAYTPNIMVYKDKYYLAYTSMKAPFNRQYSQASIGIAVSGSPDGPWSKLENNPVLEPSSSFNDPDGFLVDDAVFILKDNKIWLYYKGCPKALDDKEKEVRDPSRMTFIMVATADKPEGPYTKHSEILHRGHEAALWKEKNGIASLGARFGPKACYFSEDGLTFKPISKIARLKAASVYRADFEKEFEDGVRATWGITMKDRGFVRYDIIWPN